MTVDPGYQAAIIKIRSHPINCTKQPIETKTTLAPLSWLSISSRARKHEGNTEKEENNGDVVFK